MYGVQMRNIQWAVQQLKTKNMKARVRCKSNNGSVYFSYLNMGESAGSIKHETMQRTEKLKMNTADRQNARIRVYVCLGYGVSSRSVGHPSIATLPFTEIEFSHMKKNQNEWIK